MNAISVAVQTELRQAAAVTGYALGPGMALALCADFRVCPTLNARESPLRQQAHRLHRQPPVDDRDVDVGVGPRFRRAEPADRR